jgi:hypothetical protein
VGGAVILITEYYRGITVDGAVFILINGGVVVLGSDGGVGGLVLII